MQPNTQVDEEIAEMDDVLCQPQGSLAWSSSVPAT